EDTAPAFEDRDYTLIAELTGVSGNIVLVTPHPDAPHGRVLGSLRPPPLGGDDYTPREPPPIDRAGSVRLQIRAHLAASGDDASGRSRCVALHYRDLLRERALERRRKLLGGALRKEHKRSQRLAAALGRDLERAERAQQFKEWGDLLAANLSALTRGAAEVTLDNFYDEMKPISIPLDPARSPRENVDRYYRRYKKYRDATDDIETRYT